MTALPDLAARIEALEAHAAHRDRAADDLDAAVRTQWSALEALLRRVQALEEQLADADARAGAGLPSLPPPHY